MKRWQELKKELDHNEHTLVAKIQRLETELATLREDLKELRQDKETLDGVLDIQRPKQRSPNI